MSEHKEPHLYEVILKPAAPSYHYLVWAEDGDDATERARTISHDNGDILGDIDIIEYVEVEEDDLDLKPDNDYEAVKTSMNTTHE